MLNLSCLGRLVLLFLIPLIISGCQQSTIAPIAPEGGTDFGSGGDEALPESGSAWFLGEGRSVKVCLEVTPDYGHSATELKSIVEGAITTWKQYIEEKHLQSERATWTPRLAVDLQVSLSCSQETDIHFYFGVVTEEVKALLKHYDRPSAFARRTSYDRKRGWGKGIIWVAHPSRFSVGDADPEHRRHLTGLVLHEIGHVFGNAHVAGTIMDRRIAALLAKANYPANRIDTYRELYLCYGCNTPYTAQIPVTAKSAAVFTELTGQSPVGTIIQASLFRFFTPYWRVLELKDKTGKYTHIFPKAGRHGNLYHTVESEELIFKAWKLGMPVPDMSVTYSRVYDIEVFGSLGTAISMQIRDNFSEDGLYPRHCQNPDGGNPSRESGDSGNHVILSIYQNNAPVCFASFHQEPM